MIFQYLRILYSLATMTLLTATNSDIRVQLLDLTEYFFRRKNLS